MKKKKKKKISIKSPCKSGILLTIISSLCRSHIPLHCGGSAGVVEIFISKFSQKFENSSETNSLQLSLNSFDGLPKMPIQFSRKFLTIIGLLLLIIEVLLNQVNSSIIWKYQTVLSRL